MTKHINLTGKVKDAGGEQRQLKAIAFVMVYKIYTMIYRPKHTATRMPWSATGASVWLTAKS